jgi:hypothetical protein
MLDGLDEISWSELEDCYGPATSIPNLIRGLTCKDVQRQAKALGELGNRICHQASCSQATAPAIPYLLELARSLSIQNRERILALLQTIAIGLDFDQRYYQTKMADELAEWERQTASMTERQKRELSWGPAIGLACYSGVRIGVPDFISYLNDRNRRVRIQAAYILAWFPADYRKSLPRLRERMVTVRGTDERACSVLSVGLLEFQACVARPSRSFVRPLINDRRELVRYAAALYLYWHEPNDDVMALIRELSQNDGYDGYVGSKSLLFAGYAWNQYAERLLQIYDAKNDG